MYFVTIVQDKPSPNGDGLRALLILRLVLAAGSVAAVRTFRIIFRRVVRRTVPRAVRRSIRRSVWRTILWVVLWTILRIILRAICAVCTIFLIVLIQEILSHSYFPPVYELFCYRI